MNKNRTIAAVLILAATSFTVTTQALATSVAARAAEIKISGTGSTHADANATKRVRQAIGNAFNHGIVDKALITGYGFEGGFIACVEASPQDNGKFLEFLGKLRMIQLNKKTTSFAVDGVASCATK